MRRDARARSGSARWYGPLRHAARVPVLRAVAAPAYRRLFARAQGDVRLFAGIYPDFASALADVPPGRATSYDDPDAARRVLGEWLRIGSYDYPVLFWLSRILRESRLVFDWGGHVGLKYFAYRRYLEFNERLTWCVSDVPAVVALGREIATREDAPALRFTSGFAELPCADVLLASGSLHFIPDPFATLREAHALPPHVIVSKLPAVDAPAAVTLQNMGSAVCPYQIFNRSAFVAEFERLGYRLVDAWTSPDCSCEIPFSPEYRIAAYSGFYFVQRHAASAVAGEEGAC